MMYLFVILLYLFRFRMCHFNMFRRRYLSPEEIETELSKRSNDESIDGVQIAIIPPPTDELTDEEDIDDEEIPVENILQDVAGTLEVIGYQNSQTKEENKPSTSKSPKRKKMIQAYFPNGKSLTQPIKMK